MINKKKIVCSGIITSGIEKAKVVQGAREKVTCQYLSNNSSSMYCNRLLLGEINKQLYKKGNERKRSEIKTQKRN